jgi:alkylation response protein AidB-like acyl-CoA dehydrogenase
MSLLATYVERVRTLALRIEAAVDQIDRERRIPEPLVAALIEAGLFRLLLPRSLDGAEADPVTFVQIIEAVAKIDASIAWCLCQTAGCSMASAYLSPEVAAEVFGSPRGILAWGPGPGRAVAVDGGYRVTGTWSFASGSRLASWLGGFSTIYEPDGTPRRPGGGTPETRTMLFPVSSATLTDVWHVIGLRGTGSDTFSVSDLFVPGEHALAREDPAALRESGPLYCFPLGSVYASGFAGVALGIARAMLDAFIGLARAKTPRGLTYTLRDNAVVQSQVGQAETRLRAARLFLLASLEEIWGAVGRSGVFTLEQRMLIRMAATLATQTARDVADIAYHAAGGTAIFVSGAFERRFRDVHSVTQQYQGRQAHYETVGQFLLGIEPDLSLIWGR